MRVATVSGIPVRLHWSFLALVGFYALSALLGTGLVGLIDAVVVMAVLFGSVVLHELGHALAARSFGIRTAHITLFPFGGIAAIENMPRNPWQEAVIAIAGPAVNAVLAVGFGLAWASFGGGWLATFAVINLIMGVFNLVPAFPMDGGRVFRAILTPGLGWVRASRVAIAVGRGFAVLFVVGALALGQPSLALVGAFLLFATWIEARNVAVVGARMDAEERRRSWDLGGGYRPRWRLDP
jgi:Zn-dependent protease